MDQIGNQAAKTRYMFGGQYTIPLVIRTTIGGGKGYAGQHSQSLESVPAHFPGLKVIAAVERLRHEGAAEERHPRRQPGVLHRAPVGLPGKGGGARWRSTRSRSASARWCGEGTDITVVCYSNMVSRALAAAREAAGRGRHQRRGGGPAHAGPARHRPDRRVGAEDRAGDDRGPGASTPAATPATSATRSRGPASASSSRRCGSSPPTTCRPPWPTRWRPRTSRAWTG